MASYAAIASKPGLPPLPLLPPVVANPVVANPVGTTPTIEDHGSKDHGSNAKPTLEKEIAEWIALMGQVTTAPEQLTRLVEVLRREMEAPSGISGFRGHTTTESKAKAAGDLSFAENTKSSSNQRNFKNSASTSASHQYTTSNQNPNWRSGFSNSRFGNNSSSSAFDTRGSFDHGSKDHGSKDHGSKDHGSKDHGSKDHGSKDHGSKDHGSKDHGSKQSSPLNNKTPFASSPLEQPMTVVRPRASNPGRYKSRFKSTGNIEDKILNTIIGNKLNAFTPLTYNDTRDFIYQIMESGDQGSKEKEFTRDFIEKVFVKAVVEDLYCALFAKLIAEIAHRYPVIYEEMNKYHTEFLMIFDNVQEDTDAEYTELVKQKQYRMGYGQFIAELAGLNALETSHLMTMVSTIIDKIYKYSADENKVKTVEEFIDCLVRLTKGLQTRSPTFFKSVKGELVNILAKKLEEIIARPASNLASNNQRPSLSNKARFGLMDLKDIIQ